MPLHQYVSIIASMKSLFRSQRSNNLKLLATAICTLFVACKPVVPPTACPQTDVTYEVVAKKIKEGKAYFTTDQFDFLFKKLNFVLSDVDLIITTSGHRYNDTDFSVSFNGVKSSRESGHRSTERDDYDNNKNQTVSHIPIHKFHLNGGESFDHYLSRIKRNHGELRIDLDDVEDQNRNEDRAHRREHCHHGDNIHIVSIKLIFKGFTFDPSACTNPPPPPPPVEDPAAFSPRIDSTNPAVSPTASTNMVINFSATTAGGTFYCALDGQAAALCQSPIIYQNLASSGHSFVVSAKTPSGLPASSTATYNWVVDALPPTITITNANLLPLLSNSTLINFEFVSSKAGSNYSCRIDSSAVASCSSPKSYVGLLEGSHHFEVSAIDSLGNVSGAPAVFDWVIDATSPLTTITSVIPIAPISNLNTKSISFSANESATFQCAIDNGGFQPCSSPIQLSGVSEGNHWFDVKAVDTAGNVGPSVSYSWLTDYTAPQIAMGNIIPALGLTNSKNMSIEFAANENANFFCSIDGAAEAACSSPFANIFSTDGAHQIDVVAQDAAGNRSAMSSSQWNIDSSAPIISFAAILPSSASDINVNHLSLEVAGSENANLQVQVNGVNSVSMNPLYLSNLIEGNYTVSVFVYDSAGNPSNTINHSFTVDLTAPVISITDDGVSPSKLDSRNLSFAANEFVTYLCDLDGAGFSACSSPTSLTGLSDGSHVFSLKATDAAGNSSTTTDSWVIDTVAPTTVLAASVSGSTLTSTITSSEAGSTFVCSLDGAAFSNCLSSSTISNLSVGNHSYVARAVDAAGNVDLLGSSFTFYIEAPIQTFITSTNPADVLTNFAFMTFTFTASRAASGYVCSIDGVAFTACNSGVNYIELIDGVHSFIVKAIDLNGVMDIVGASHAWTVDTTSPVPSHPPTITIGVNTITVSWTTDEPATTQLKYGVGGSAGINKSTVDNGVMSLTHTVTLTGLISNTLYSLRVAGHDLAGNTYLGNSVTVQTKR